MDKNSDKVKQKSEYDFSFDFNVTGNGEEDAIGAYFKQRLQHRESLKSIDRESSLGILDLGEMSVLDTNSERHSSVSQLLRNSLSLIDSTFSKSKNYGPESKAANDDFVFKRPYTPKKEDLSESQLNLQKQRELAQKALQQASVRMKSFTNSKKLSDDEQITSKSPQDITESFRNVYMSSESGKIDSKWFEQNLTPETPRYFRDELNSLCADDLSLLPSKAEYQSNLVKNFIDEKYLQHVNELTNEPVNLSIGSEEFYCHKPEEALDRFAEDEKKFIAEQSVLSHNSDISQFSGIAEGDFSRRSSMAGNTRKQDQNKNKLSIDQFLEKQFKSINSLVGQSIEHNYSVNSSSFDRNLASSTLTNEGKRESHPSSYVKASDDILEKFSALQELKKSPDFHRRHLNESFGSNNTISIKNILSELESGLSGSEIYDKLIKATSKEKAIGISSPVENFDTPKTSKIQKKRICESSAKSKSESGSDKTSEQSEPPALEPCSRHPRKWTPKSGLKSSETKENTPVGRQVQLIRADENVLSLRNEKVKKSRKRYDSSTPKSEFLRSARDPLSITPTSRRVIEEADDDWKSPRVSVIKPNPLFDKSRIIDRNDTLVFNCSEISTGSNRRTRTLFPNDTIRIEDSIVDGDLTLLSQRINQIKLDSSSEIRPCDKNEPAILTIVQKLANFPKGTIDCSALTPLIRDEFPELLSSEALFFGYQSLNESIRLNASLSSGDPIKSEPGSWINLASRRGYSDKIFSSPEVEKLVYVPLINVSKRWLLISAQSVSIRHHLGRHLDGVRQNDKWIVDDFLNVRLKETIVPPSSQQSLKIFVTARIPALLNIKITLHLKDLLNHDAQLRDTNLLINSVNPMDDLIFAPEEPINFGVIPEQCIDEKTIIVSYNGVCDLPVKVFVKECSISACPFFLSPEATLNGVSVNDEAWQDGSLFCTLKGGENQVLEFKILFQSPNLPDPKKTPQIDYKASVLVSVVTSNDVDGTLHATPLTGSVGYSKFLCNPSCSPLVFKTTAIGKSVIRTFPLKNVGSMPLKFTVQIVCEKTKKEQTDGMFIAPKSICLPKNEETEMNITFTAHTKDNYVKRLLTLQMKPNGQVLYDVELIGIVIPSSENKPNSRYSSRSESATSVSSSDMIPVKLLSTTQSVSWAGVPLEKEVKQTFQIKNSSDVKATARISFQKDCHAFKILNDEGEKITKLRKCLKPNAPSTITVVFRPDTVGAHHNAIIIETNAISRKNMISLNGYGGSHNVFISNAKTDLNGHKMVKLHNLQPESQIFSNALDFYNQGDVPGFVSITPTVKVLALTHELVINPSKFVVEPNGKVTVHISQKLKNEDIKTLLSGRDISNLATLSIVTGDEPNRLRMRNVIEKGLVVENELLTTLTGKFINEMPINVKRLDDNQLFKNVFKKSLRAIEVAAVIERSSGFGEPTIVEDEDETLKEFVTICPAVDNTIVSPVRSQQMKPSSLTEGSKTRIKINESSSSSSAENSIKNSRKIAEWLETLEDPAK